MSTKKVAVRDLIPGMIVSKAVLSDTGKILLDRDFELTPKAIALLTIWGIDAIEIAEAVEATSPGAFEKEQLSLTQEHKEFIETYDSIVSDFSESYDFIRGNKQIPYEKLKHSALNIYATVISTGPVIMNYLLASENHNADKIAQHSIKVAFFSSLIGRRLKLLSDQVNFLILGALLHDVGKLVISPAEEADEKTHVILGGRLVNEIADIPPEVMLGVLQHHECMDGTGFPLGSKGERIHLYARIIAVANIFENTAYQNGIFNPFEALKRFSKEMFDKLDPGVCHPFITYLKESLINVPVMLNDGRMATIIYFNSINSPNPMVKTTEGAIIDLAEDKNVSIHHVITPANSAR